MKRSEQQMHIMMDESDAPYESGQYDRTLEDDLSLIRLAERYGLEFKPDSYLAKLSQTMKDKERNAAEALRRDG